jgi:hypothetical protein
VADHDHDDEIERFGRCLTCTDRGLDRKVATGPPPGEQLALLGTPEPAEPGAPAALSAEDQRRLGEQARRVLALMVDGSWRTLGEIAAATGDPEASISARLRDLRQPWAGSYVVDSRVRDPARPGLHEYRVTLPRST